MSINLAVTATSAVIAALLSLSALHRSNRNSPAPVVQINTSGGRWQFLAVLFLAVSASLFTVSLLGLVQTLSNSNSSRVAEGARSSGKQLPEDVANAIEHALSGQRLVGAEALALYNWLTESNSFAQVRTIAAVNQIVPGVPRKEFEGALGGRNLDECEKTRVMEWALMSRDPVIDNTVEIIVQKMVHEQELSESDRLVIKHVLENSHEATSGTSAPSGDKSPGQPAPMT